MEGVLTKFTLSLYPILQGMSVRCPARKIDLVRAPLNILSIRLRSGRGRSFGKEMPDHLLVRLLLLCL